MSWAGSRQEQRFGNKRYRRYAMEDEDRQVLSLESQSREMTRLSLAWPSAEITTALAEARSAKVPGRPIFTDMMKRIERGEAGDLEGQLACFLDEVTLGNSFHAWAIERLDRVRKSKSAALATEEAALRRNAATTDRSIDNLTRLRLREVITDEEFLKQRQELEREKLALEQRLRSVGDPSTWFEPCRDFISFNSRATAWFRAGDERRKRLIVEIVGSNPVLKDKILSIEAAKPFRRHGPEPRRPLLWAEGDSNSQSLAGTAF